MIGIAALEKEGKVEEARRLKEELAQQELDHETAPHMAFCNFQDDASNSLYDLLNKKRAGAGGASSRALQQEEAEAREFFLLLAGCHTVTVEDGGRFSASSPDEQALVAGAANFVRLFASSPPPSPTHTHPPTHTHTLQAMYGARYIVPWKMPPTTRA